MRWINVAWPVWLSLVLGYLFVFFSLTFDFQFPSSGAVLVASSVLAEMIFQRLPWKKNIGALIYRPIENMETIDGEKTNMYIAGKISTSESSTVFGFDNDPFSSLYSLSRPGEKTNDRPGWLAHKTAERVEFVVTICIGVSVILGTIIWGYSEWFLSWNTAQCV